MSRILVLLLKNRLLVHVYMYIEAAVTSIVLLETHLRLSSCHVPPNLQDMLHLGNTHSIMFSVVSGPQLLISQFITGGCGHHDQATAHPARHLIQFLFAESFSSIRKQHFLFLNIATLNAAGGLRGQLKPALKPL